MKISYLITCSTETDTLKRLLKKISNVVNDDEIVILMDESHANENNETYNIVGAFHHVVGSYITTHPLNANYGTHKNFGTSKCSGDWIFQIDGDELPADNIIGENLHSIIDSNSEIELIYVPRINDYRGVNEENARPWGWRLTKSKQDGMAQGRMLVNWCDYQSRIFRNIPDRIKWDRKLHEKIVGHNQYSFLPAEEEYALYHDKTIEKQLETNLRYNKVFTVEDNMGHKVI
jgi:glycosyltransferase involved in cell wall biosynthesis